MALLLLVARCGGEEASLPTGEPLFREEAAAVGLDVRHVAGNPGSYFFPEIMSGGVALLDVDGDGRLDVYVVNGNRRNLAPGPDEDTTTNRLFRQQADGTFREATAGSGLDDPSYGVGVAVGDVDNDGAVDVYVTNYGPDRLYRNRGDGTFDDVTVAAGIDNPRWGSSAAFLDYDRDGRLDLYVANYVSYSPTTECNQRTGARDYCSPAAFQPTIDRLYRNVSAGGEVRFEDVTEPAGIAAARGSGLGVAPLDHDADGWPDLYVANDGNPNMLWANQRDGTFREEAVLLGVAYDLQGKSQAGMGVATADLDGDERPEIFVTNLDGETNALYASSGGLGFDESTTEKGLGIPSFPSTGFGAAFADFDADGDLDLAVANGRVVRPRHGERRGAAPSGERFWEAFAEPDQLFLNDGHGGFVERRSASGFGSLVETSRALCAGDLDNDGDVDLVVSNTGGPLRLWRNVATPGGHWLRVRAVLPEAGGRDAYGARVTVAAGGRTLARDVQPGASYLSSQDPRPHFGLAAAERYDALTVRWPDGTRERFPGGEADREVRLEKGRGEPG